MSGETPPQGFAMSHTVKHCSTGAACDLDVTQCHVHSRGREHIASSTQDCMGSLHRVAPCALQNEQCHRRYHQLTAATMKEKGPACKSYPYQLGVLHCPSQMCTPEEASS